MVGHLVFLHFFVDKHAGWRFREPPDRGKDFVVLEEVLHLELSDAPLGLHQPQQLVVPVLTDVGETSGEYDQAALLAAEHHLLKDTPVHVVVVDHAGDDNDVKRI